MPNVLNLVPTPVAVGTGVDLSINPGTDWVSLNSMRVRLTMSAKAAVRAYVFVFSDAASPPNKLFTAVAPFMIAGLLPVLSFGGGCNAIVGHGSDNASVWATVTLPVDFALPPGAMLNIHDGNFADPADVVNYVVAVTA